MLEVVTARLLNIINIYWRLGNNNYIILDNKKPRLILNYFKISAMRIDFIHELLITI